MSAAVSELGRGRQEGPIQNRERLIRLPGRRARSGEKPNSTSSEHTTAEALNRVRHALSREARIQRREEQAQLRATYEQRANNILDELGFDYEHEPKDLLQAIHEAETIADKFGFRMIVVGGAGLARYVDGQPDVHITSLDHTQRTVTIQGAKDPKDTLIREDGTVTDIDTIVIRKDGIDPFTPQTKEDYEALKKALDVHVARRKENATPDGQQLRTPSIAVETVSYHPSFPEPGMLKKTVNFNSRIDVYRDPLGNEHWFTTLGHIRTEFNPEILQTWRVKFVDRPEDEGIPTLMIPAYRQRFFMRGATIKEKDKKKTGKGSALYNLQEEFYALSQIQGKEPQYRDLMSQWETFTSTIQHDPRLFLHRFLYTLYWRYGGEKLAHEAGFIGEVVQPFRGVTTGEISIREATKQAVHLARKYIQKRLHNPAH